MTALRVLSDHGLPPARRVDQIRSAYRWLHWPSRSAPLARDSMAFSLGSPITLLPPPQPAIPGTRPPGSNPRPTIRLRPFCSRTSYRRVARASRPGTPPLATSTNPRRRVFPCSRFFHAVEMRPAHSLRSWQNVATLFPLRICSEISLRHFVHAFSASFWRHRATLLCD